MDQSHFEALQRAAVQQAASHGIYQPSTIDYVGVPDNVMELQRGYRDAVINGKLGAPTFNPIQRFTKELGNTMRQSQLELLRRLFGG